MKAQAQAGNGIKENVDKIYTMHSAPLGLVANYARPPSFTCLPVVKWHSAQCRKFPYACTAVIVQRDSRSLKCGQVALAVQRALPPNSNVRETSLARVFGPVAVRFATGGIG